MADYSTNLKSWGDVGEEFPNGYHYIKGEQPVDAWDNFVNRNLITDVQHLVELTNKRLESESGTGYPGSPEPGHLVWRSDARVLAVFDENNSSWRELAYKSDVDSIDFSDYDNHIADTSNPHGVTVQQIGAATTAEHDAHTADTSNPHNVTAEQVGAPEGEDTGNVLGATATGNSVAIGERAETGDEDSVSIGTDAQTDMNTTVAIGVDAHAGASNSVCVGTETTGWNYQATALGFKAYCGGGNGVALGSTATVEDISGLGQGPVAIGQGATVGFESPGGIAIGGDAKTDEEYSIAIGNGAYSEREYSTAVGPDATADKYATSVGWNSSSAFRSTAIGRGSLATGSYSFAAGDGAEAPETSSVAIGRSAEALNRSEVVLGTSLREVIVPGDFSVSGSKNFEINHPSKPSTHDLRHGAYEGPTAGGVVYRDTVTVEEGEGKPNFPEYVVNGDFGTNWTATVSPVDHFGSGYLDTHSWTVHANEDGDYHIHLLGDRNDPAIEKFINEDGSYKTEKPKGLTWDGEPRTYWRDHPDFDAGEWGDAVRVEQKFSHNTECDDKPCVEAFDEWRVTFYSDDPDNEELVEIKLNGVNPDADMNVVTEAAKAKKERFGSEEEVILEPAESVEGGYEDAENVVEEDDE